MPWTKNQICPDNFPTFHEQLICIFSSMITVLHRNTKNRYHHRDMGLKRTLRRCFSEVYDCDATALLIQTYRNIPNSVTFSKTHIVRGVVTVHDEPCLLPCGYFFAISHVELLQVTPGVFMELQTLLSTCRSKRKLSGSYYAASLTTSPALFALF